MKPEKRQWLDKIAELERAAVSKIRMATIVRIVCHAYIAISALVIIGVSIWGFWLLFTDRITLSPQDINEYATYFMVAIFSFLTAIFVECTLGTQLMMKGFQLGAEMNRLKQSGWNGEPSAHPAS